MCEVNPWWGRAGDRARPGLVAGSVLKHLSLPVPVLMLFWVSTSSGGRENESESVSSSIVSDSATLWTVAHQAPLSMGFPRPEYWSGWPFPPPGDLPNPWIKPGSPALQADSLLSEPPGRPLRDRRTLPNTPPSHPKPPLGGGLEVWGSLLSSQPSRAGISRSKSFSYLLAPVPQMCEPCGFSALVRSHSSRASSGRYFPPPLY